MVYAMFSIGILGFLVWSYNTPIYTCVRNISIFLFFFYVSGERKNLVKVLKFLLSILIFVVSVYCLYVVIDFLFLSNNRISLETSRDQANEALREVVNAAREITVIPENTTTQERIARAAGQGTEYIMNRVSPNDLFWAGSSGLFAKYVFTKTPGSVYVKASAGGLAFATGVIGKSIGNKISEYIENDTSGVTTPKPASDSSSGATNSAGQNYPVQSGDSNQSSFFIDIWNFFYDIFHFAFILEPSTQSFFYVFNSLVSVMYNCLLLILVTFLFLFFFTIVKRNKEKSIFSRFSKIITENNMEKILYIFSIVRFILLTMLCICDFYLYMFCYPYSDIAQLCHEALLNLRDGIEYSIVQKYADTPVDYF